MRRSPSRSPFSFALALLAPAGFLLALAAPPASADGAPTGSALCAEVLGFARDARAELGVPGMAVALVTPDEVLCAEGLGQSEVETGIAVTADTGFYLASVSKSFLGLAAAILAQEGALDLEAPITRYLPELTLPEPLDPRAITVRDLLTHRSGLVNRDVERHLPFVGALDRSELMARLAASTTSSGPGFRYTNLGYYLVGEIVESVTGQSWKEVVRQRVLAPAGMKRTVSSMTAATGGAFAWPYQPTATGLERLEVKSDSQMHAAGGHVSTADDLARWVRLQLGQGELDGRQIFPRAAVAEAQRPQAEVSASFYSFHRTGYGFGLYDADLAGIRVQHHFGGFDGYQAHTSFAPELGLGVVALSNATENGRGELPHLTAELAYRLYAGDRLAESELRARLDALAEGVRSRDRLAQRVEEVVEQWRQGKVLDAAATLAAGLDAHRDILDRGALNRLGYRFLGDDQVPLALVVFRRNIERHPEDSNPWDSLGEGLERAGDLEGAAAAYAKAVARAEGADDQRLFEANRDRATAALATAKGGR